MSDTAPGGLGTRDRATSAGSGSDQPFHRRLSPGAWFRVVAIAEAISWAGLLIGMLFKYVISDTEIGVTIFGPIHGIVFIIYVLVTLLVFRPLRWGPWTTVWALAASVPPLTTLVFERWAVRTGRLSPELRHS
ncbi:DUF3817 domain-containing protein [Phytoactinopolyspora mesophila]|uniref:DUF3817 domain-containing protein n=1 Tax=Phytoactinopolyspora mesophila TaxID=2650750 RepID=A0A7K3MC02_9ACTN|nr:DUF3817 domain-containing protein [Phytoactinopolyspora mesophila]NDL59918.1 DUF3817 domain-containing protein [Phytoactinopolyspora mesophila]